MSKFFISCINNIFIGNDYNNLPIKYCMLKNHTNEDNAWVMIDNNVYSIQKNDKMLLNIFKNHYGKNVKDYIYDKSNFNIKTRILILDKLSKRKIGYLVINQ